MPKSPAAVNALTEIAVNRQQVQTFMAVGAPAPRRQLAQQLHQRVANIGTDIFVFAVAVQRQPAVARTHADPVIRLFGPAGKVMLSDDMLSPLAMPVTVRSRL